MVRQYEKSHTGMESDPYIIPYTIHNTQHTIHNTQYTIHNTQYAIHNTHYAIHKSDRCPPEDHRQAAIGIMEFGLSLLPPSCLPLPNLLQSGNQYLGAGFQYDTALFGCCAGWVAADADRFALCGLPILRYPAYGYISIRF